MSVLTLVVLGAIFAGNFTPAVATKANVLLEMDDGKSTFKLNASVLQEISELQRPIRVIAAVGNARVGKSTMLNVVSHMWGNMGEVESVEEIFKTGDSVEAVTRNVWAHIIQPRNGEGNILFIDVEGINLGDDRVTDQLSMFTAMMSSGLNVFALDVMGNSDIDFLYRISRLSDLVFQNNSGLQNFPRLHIVVRSNLKHPDDNGNHILDKIFKPNNQESTQNKGDIIKRYFPRDSIVVSYIPSVNDAKILNNLTALRKNSHWDSFGNLITKLRNSPEKRFLEGSPVDGEALKTLAEKLVEAMNKNSWNDFGDVFATMESDICGKSYAMHVEPVLMQSSREIEDTMLERMEEFKKKCFLKREIADTMKELKRALKEAKKREESEERRRKEEEEKRKWFTCENIMTAGCIFFTNLFTYYFFSDQHLKDNVTTLPYSQFNEIGLTGVCWEWNKVAEKNYGLTGKSCGVIAQEVQKLYPWAVIGGKDGYLQVGYEMLHEMIYHARHKN